MTEQQRKKMQDIDVCLGLMETSINALSDLQKYRRIGTVEEFKRLKGRSDTMLKFVVIVTIDKREWWRKGVFPASKSYYSDLFDTEEEVKEFLQQVNEDFPDNNMTDFNHNHEWLIRHMKFRINPQVPAEFEAIKEVAKAEKHYSEAKGECAL